MLYSDTIWHTTNVQKGIIKTTASPSTRPHSYIHVASKSLVLHTKWKALKCKPSVQVMQIAYSNIEHFVGSKDTSYVMEKQFVYS